MTLEQITTNFTDTDKILYNTPAIKLKPLEAGKTKVMNK